LVKQKGLPNLFERPFNVQYIEFYFFTGGAVANEIGKT
jgi:hypothetical protein